MVKAKKTDPIFFMEPVNGIIEFPKKIIISQDSVVPEYKTLTISNLNKNKSLIWNLD